MILYVYSKCSTCQQAIKFLEQKKVKYLRKEITVEPPSIEELKTMLKFQQGNLKKLFNTSGQLYREMELSEALAGMSEMEALTLLSQHGMLVKRPFLLGRDFGLVGFKLADWSKKISNCE